MKNEWNYFMCNQCYVMFPHLTTPEVCVCGNDMKANSTRRKFILSHRIKDVVDELLPKYVEDGADEFAGQLMFALLGKHDE